MRPRPDPGAAALPASPARRRRALPVVLVAGTAITAALVFVGGRPIRLLSQAKDIGPASAVDRAAPTPSPRRYYDDPAPGTDVSTAGDGFPYAADLPDGRRSLALVFPKAPDDPDDTTRPTRADSHGGKLYLTANDSPGQPCIADFPAGMDALAGITDDHRIVGVHLREEAEARPTANPSPTPTPVATQAATLPVRPVIGKVAANGDDRPITVDLTRFGVMDNPAPLERLRVTAPRSGQVREIAVSPSGDHLLWAIYFSREPYALVTWAAHYCSPLAPYARTRPAVAVYVTDIHGNDARRIGEETAGKLRADPKSKDFGDALTPLPEHFRWEPKDAAISFVDGDREYRVATALR